MGVYVPCDRREGGRSGCDAIGGREGEYDGGSRDGGDSF